MTYLHIGGPFSFWLVYCKSMVPISYKYVFCFRNKIAVSKQYLRKMASNKWKMNCGHIFLMIISTEILPKWLLLDFFDCKSIEPISYNCVLYFWNITAVSKQYLRKMASQKWKTNCGHIFLVRILTEILKKMILTLFS